MIATVILSFAGSCREDKVPPTRMEQVMAIHDSVMPEMSTISRLVSRLKPLADSTESGQAYQKAMEDLQEAHTAMMDWMKGFGDRFDHEEIMKGKELSPQKQEWLREEEVKVKAMADKVNGSIVRAKALLDTREESED
ncbi:MAG: hypothetical protein EP302_09365 [Bacteroidetes bacterium]|nr:MAG: hypothetical protein EP302_09365 [Bacteroidota bacterium]